jgi:hypothetical protein
MRIYRNSYRIKDGHQCYEYFGNGREAAKAWHTAAKGNIDDESFEVELDTFNYPITKKGMLAALNCLGKHPDNG